MIGNKLLVKIILVARAFNFQTKQIMLLSTMNDRVILPSGILDFDENEHDVINKIAKLYIDLEDPNWIAPFLVDIAIEKDMIKIYYGATIPVDLRLKNDAALFLYLDHLKSFTQNEQNIINKVLYNNGNF